MLLKRSNDNSHRCGRNRNDCENYIPQVCHWNIFEIVFHSGSSFGHLREGENCPTSGNTSASRTGPYEKIAIVFNLLQTEERLGQSPSLAQQHYTHNETLDCCYPQRRHV